MIEFHPTLTFGDLVTLAGFLVGVVALYAKFSNRLSILEFRMNDLWAWFMSDKPTRQRIGRALDERDERNGGTR